MSASSYRLLGCLLLATFLADALSAAAEAPVPSTASLTIGIIVPPTEPNAASLQRGAELAISEANATGTVQVRLEVRSQDGQWGTMGNEAVALACNLHADGMIAPSDGAATHLILQVSGRTRVPVATVCTDASVTETGVPWVIRVVPSTDRQVTALLNSALRPDHVPARWWAVLPPGRAGRPIRRDLEVVGRTTATVIDRYIQDPESNQELASLAHAIITAAPDGMLMWLAPARAGAFASVLRAEGYRGHLAGPGSLDCPQFIAAAGTAAAGFLVAECGADQSHRSESKSFKTEFRRNYGTDPDSSAAAGYDAACVLIQALRPAAHGDGYRQFPISVAAFGATGGLHFDEFGNRTDALQVLVCRQGRFLPVSSGEM